jgi:hypothetical protein
MRLERVQETMAADARTLPPAVFTCDKVLEEEQQL